MADPAIAPSPPDVNSTFGVLFIGFILGVTFYGLTFFQTYVFFSRFPKERLLVKCTVGLLWGIDTVTTALLSHMQYFYLITSFLKPWDVLPVTRTFMVEKGLASLAIFIVQLYYAITIYSVSGKNVYIAGAVAFLALLAFVFAIVASVQISNRELIATLVTPSMKIVIALNEGVAALCSVSILGALFYCFRAARHPELKTSNDLFERVVLMVVNRGTSFTLWQIVLFFTFIAKPHSQVWILIHFIVSKIYVNSLFSMLNSRKAAHGRGVNEEDDVVGYKQTKGPQSGLSARSGTVDPIEFARNHHPPTMTIELGPVTSRSDMEHLDRPKSSMDSATLSPVSPMSVKTSVS